MDRRNLVVDIVTLLMYLVVANPAVIGIGVHEWISLGLLVAFFVHVVLHVGWMLEVARGTFSNLSWVRVGYLILNASILIAFMTATISGLLISGAVLPALGLYAEGYYFWDPLHAVSAKLLLALLLIHVLAHWRWLARAFKKGRGVDHG